MFCIFDGRWPVSFPRVVSGFELYPNYLLVFFSPETEYCISLVSCPIVFKAGFLNQIVHFFLGLLFQSSWSKLNKNRPYVFRNTFLEVVIHALFLRARVTHLFALYIWINHFTANMKLVIENIEMYWMSQEICTSFFRPRNHNFDMQTTFEP